MFYFLNIDICLLTYILFKKNIKQKVIFRNIYLEYWKVKLIKLFFAIAGCFKLSNIARY